jgi:SAM-dependent methyltransferase
MRGRRTGTASGGATADRHALYERAVQDPDDELALVERLLRRAGRPAARLREDFSGTALVAATWVARAPTRTAVAVDLDPEVHAWARAHRLPSLGDAARRLRLVRCDVRAAPRGPFDAIVAFNYSWQVFRTREALRAYLAAARRSLSPGGVLVLDAFGGWDAERPLVERRRIRGGARYVWEQESFDPITHRIRCAIHFELADGRALRRAFRYDWRLWSLPEVTELAREAGFADVDVLWDVAPAGESPRYVRRRGAENDPGWIAYVVARTAPRARPDGAVRTGGARERRDRGARRGSTAPRRSRR